MAPRVILASGSAARRQMLAAAGLSFDVIPSEVDEGALRYELDVELLIHDGFPQQVAQVLAEAKAVDVSRRHPGALVIGADQVLRLAGSNGVFTKPCSRTAARTQLRQLSGKTHLLHSAVVLALDGKVVWHELASSAMTMRDVSDAFIDDYLTRASDTVCTSVGAYQLEGLGIQLFEKIEGDYFTILGLPLLPLLAELRRLKVILV